MSKDIKTGKDKSNPLIMPNSQFMFLNVLYQGLDIDSFTKKDINFAQKHLRILSGLYGILKPLDIIEPYRLEIEQS